MVALKRLVLSPAVVLFTLLIAVVAGATEFIGGIQTSKFPTPFPVKGVTIGAYGCDYNGTDQTPFTLALAAGHKHLEVVNGTFTFTAPITTSLDDIEIECRSGVNFVNDADESVGLFSFTGVRPTIKNLHATISNWVNSQSVMKFASKFPRIEDCYIDVTTTGGNNTTPMTVFEFTSCVNSIFEHNIILPNKGIRAGLVTDGHGGRFCFNQIRNDSTAGIGATGEMPGTDDKYREMYRGFEFQGGSWFACDDNQVWDIGASGKLVDKVFYYNQVDTPTSTEHGHFSMSRNKVEAVAPVRSFIHLAGAVWFTCDNNEMGFAKDVCTALGAADIVLTARITDDAATEDTNAAFATTNGSIRNNQLHRFTAGHVPPVGGGDDSFACNIYLSRSKNILIADNLCTLVYGYSAMLIDSTTCTDLDFQNNMMVSNDITAEYGIAFIGTAGANYSFRGNFGRNIGSGIIQPGLTGSDLTYGLLGWKAAAKTTITFNTSGVISDSANGLARIKVGNWVWLAQGAGGSGSVAANNLGLRRVTAVGASGASITVEPAPGTTDGTAGESVDIFLLDGNPDQP